MAQTRMLTPALHDTDDKDIVGMVAAELDELDPIWKKVYNVRKSARKFERVQQFAGFSTVSAVGEGEDYPTDVIRQGPSKDFTHLSFKLAFEVTEEAEEDDQHDVIAQYATSMARAARVAEETYGARPFNLGFTTETTPDGQPIFDTAHPLITGGTTRNELPTPADLSVTSLEQALIDIQTQVKSEEGHYLTPKKGLTLYVHPSNLFNAHRIVKSAGLPGSAENDTNAINDLYKIQILANPYLSDEDAFFLLDGGKAHGFLSYTRVGIEMKPMERMPRSGNRIYKLRFRRSWGCRRWQGAVGSPGA
jgi:hypothetical protein